MSEAEAVAIDGSAPPEPEAAAERARRYLLAGDPALALGACEAAVRGASAEVALGLRVVAGRAAQDLGDLDAERRHLEAAEALARSRGLDVLGPVLLQLGECHLRRAEPVRAALALDEARSLLAADDPLRGRASTSLEEARAREAELTAAAADGSDGSGDEPGDEPGDDPHGAGRPRAASAHAPLASPAASGAAQRLLVLTDRLLEADPDLDLSALLDLVLAEVVEAVGADRGFVLLFEPGEGLVVRAARDARGFAVLDPAREVSRKIAERAATESIALRAVRPAEDPRFAGSRSAKALDLQAVVAAPLRYRTTDLGCVVLDRRGSRVSPFDEATEDLLARFARTASGVIVRTRRRDAQKRRNEALMDLFARGTDQLRTRLRAGSIVGRSEAMYQLLRVLERVAASEARVLIRGESGTGKELIARTLHENSPRASAPFHAINCAALAESLLEDQLFGHVKGAFSGATGDHPGLFEQAHRGTLFLDEVGDASPRLQAELLRVLQEGEVRRLGDEVVRQVDVRVLAATHQDLEAMVAEGRFREDLFYRLNVVEVRVPPLRERPEDIAPLAHHFAVQARALLTDPSRGQPLDDAAVAELATRPWPGNVRQLQNAIQRLVMTGALPAADESPLRPAPRATHASAVHDPLPGQRPDEVITLEEAERRAIVRALRASGGMRQEAASLLNVPRRTLYNKIKAHGLD